MDRQQGAVARLVLGPKWQGTRRAVADPMKASEKPVGQRRALMRHEVERIAHQVAVQHRDGGGPGALHQMGKRREVGLLTLVQGHGPGGFD